MKLLRTLLLVGAFAIGPVAAQDLGVNTSATLKQAVRQLDETTPAAKAAAARELGLGGLNTRAWTTIVGWNASTSAMADGITHESKLRLVSFRLD